MATVKALEKKRDSLIKRIEAEEEKLAALNTELEEIEATIEEEDLKKLRKAIVDSGKSVDDILVLIQE